MTHYLVTFENNRIGRNHNVPSRVFQAGDWGGLAHAVHGYARRHLYSHPDVIIDQGEGEDRPRGLIFAGFHTVGRFTIEEVPGGYTAPELRSTAPEQNRAGASTAPGQS
jgi:hypothetical protein